MTDFFEDIEVNLASPFNYTGSKFELLPQLNNLFPEKHTYDTFYDLFCGGGSITVNLLNKHVVANDIFKPIIDFYIELQTKDWQYIYKEINKNIDKCKTKDTYYAFTKEYNENKNPYGFFALNCCCLNNMMRINKKMNWNASYGQRSVNASIFSKLVGYWNRINNNKLLKFVSGNFYDIKPLANSFVYLDPPYIITDVGYTNIWSEELDNLMFEYMDDLNKQGIRFAMSNVAKNKGIVYDKLLKTVKDCKYNIHKIKHDYGHVGVIGNANPEKDDTEEVLVTNY